MSEIKRYILKEGENEWELYTYLDVKEIKRTLKKGVKIEEIKEK